MVLPRLILVPDADGYQGGEVEEVTYTPLEGGPGRTRRDCIGGTKIVAVKWTLNPRQYAYWRAFYSTTVARGELPFTCPLNSDDGTGPADHTCRFVPGSVSQPTVGAFTYVMRASLEVTPLPRNETVDEEIVMVYGLLGDEASTIFADLAILVNVTMPEDFNA
jgi:hypothetical protein